jgi:hypothetical protein
MNPAEQRLQRDGYVNAFRHPEILAAISRLQAPMPSILLTQEVP